MKVCATGNQRKTRTSEPVRAIRGGGRKLFGNRFSWAGINGFIDTCGSFASVLHDSLPAVIHLERIGAGFNTGFAPHAGIFVNFDGHLVLREFL